MPLFVEAKIVQRECRDKVHISHFSTMPEILRLLMKLERSSWWSSTLEFQEFKV